MRNPLTFIVPIVAVLGFGLFAAMFMTETVDPGHSAAGSIFGDVAETPLGPGFHIVNPLMDFTHYDCRQKTHLEAGVAVPSQDKLVTMMDVSVQYHLNESMTPTMLDSTGDTVAVINTHLIPKLRSLLREQGKTVERAEEFFLEETQTALQANVLSHLSEFCNPNGIAIDAILIRDITLPQVIVNAVEQTKERQEQTEREQAEFERFEIEQQKQVAAAAAQREAAEEEAARKRTLADAAAYEIETRGQALRENPEILQLESIQRWDGVLPRFVGGEAGNMQFLMPLDTKNQ
jgi:regulator of protease activity HflC (stomatin/prohibitin superfamily)